MVVLAGVAACLVALTATPTVLGHMRRLAAIDEVSERSSHRVPTPRGGGVAVALGLFAGILFLILAGILLDGALPGAGNADGGADTPNLLPLAVAAALFGLIGLAEDVGGVPPLRRFALQLVAGMAVASVVLLWAALDAGSMALTAVLLALLGPVWLTAFVNAFNFMDGINGISAAQTVLGGAAFAVVGALHDLPALAAGGAIAAGAALGFAPFNFPRARLFLGDVGSYCLGAALAVLALQAAVAGVPPEAAVAPLLLYLADTGTTLLRRIRQGERWYLPHRTHVYQRLTDVGWTHTRVTLTVGALIAAVSALGLTAPRAPLAGRVCLDLAVCALLAGYLRAPSLLAAAQARRGRQAAPPGPMSIPRPRTSADSPPGTATGEHALVGGAGSGDPSDTRK